MKSYDYRRAPSIKLLNLQCSWRRVELKSDYRLEELTDSGSRGGGDANAARRAEYGHKLDLEWDSVVGGPNTQQPRHRCELRNYHANRQRISTTGKAAPSQSSSLAEQADVPAKFAAECAGQPSSLSQGPLQAGAHLQAVQGGLPGAL
eukprot:jgi/Botrbrau1/9962/Bobra.0012s0057.1